MPRPNPYGRRYSAPPPVVAGYAQDARVSVIMPPTTAIINLVANPSVEVNTTGYTAGAGSLARVTTKQRRGAYSLQYTPSAAVNDGFYYGTVSVAAGVLYPWSFDFWGAAGYKYKAYWATTAGAQLSTAVQFIGAGRWQRIQVPWIETSSTTRRLYVVKDNQANTRPFYVDGMLIPSGANDFEEWRYFDGDTDGFVPNQVDFYWNGTPHGSTSTMRPNSRAGGRVIPLARYGFTLLALLGLGMKTPNNINLPLALPGGAQYQRTLAPVNDFSLVGYVNGVSGLDLRQKQMALRNLLDVRQQPVTQPLLLQYEPLDDCGEASGERVEVQCSFSGGLEGQWDNNYQENVNLKFTVFLPYVAALYGTVGASLDVRDQFTAGYVAKRDVNGVWSALQTSGLGASVSAIATMPDGRYLIGGSFTNAGGVADADYLAYYDPVTDVFSAVNATPLNNAVTSILLLPSGNVLIGGAFTNAGGDANADALALITTSTGAFSSLNATPLNNLVNALALLQDGNVAVGGSFTNAGGDPNADYLCKLTISTGAFSSFSATLLNGSVNALATTIWGDLYVGGAFTNVGGFAEQDYLTVLRSPYTSFQRLMGNTALNGQVLTIKPVSDGSVLIGGQMTDVNGDTTWDYLIRSIQAPPGNTTELPLLWSKPFSSIDNAVYAIAEAQPGTVLVGGQFTSVAGVALFDGLFQYTGATLLPIDLDLPGSITVGSIAGRPTGEVVIGFFTTGTASTSGTTTVTNPGTAPSQPVIVIQHPTTASLTAPLYSIRNLTTGKIVSFNLTLLIGETVTIDFGQGTITSDLRGNLISTILPGSNFDTFALVPGPNIINIFSSLSSGSLPSAYLYWTPLYASVADVGATPTQ